MTHVSRWLTAHLGGTVPVAIGHRVVHGGPQFTAPQRVDAAVLDALEKLVPLAPLHQPYSLHPIRTIQAHFPSLPQVACFDTAFHRGHPEVADRYALPDALYREGVRRYGFHGLSYEYIARSLPRVAPEIARGAVVVAHLGSGASMCALREGRSVESTMGFTALDGLPMGTRCGQIDPGVLLYLLGQKGWSVKDLEHLLYHEAGLRGLSGLSNDVRDLLASDAPGARLALDYFVHRIARETASLAAALGGIDALVFTAGVGENSPDIRARVCARAEWLGLGLDEAANRAGGPRISAPGSRVSAWVIPTDEERMIAEHTLEIVK
jgi:acetate kinase